MRGVQGHDGGGIYGRSQYDSAWASSRGATKLENLGHRGRSADLFNGLPGQLRTAELPSGGMPGPSGKKVGDAGSLTIPACPGHRGHSGVGKPPPITVQPMQYAVPLEGTERQTPCHRLVCQGIGAKEVAASRCVAEGEIGEGIQVIRGAAGKCDGV